MIFRRTPRSSFSSPQEDSVSALKKEFQSLQVRTKEWDGGVTFAPIAQKHPQCLIRTNETEIRSVSVELNSGRHVNIPLQSPISTSDVFSAVQSYFKQPSSRLSKEKKAIEVSLEGYGQKKPRSQDSNVSVVTMDYGQQEDGSEQNERPLDHNKLLPSNIGLEKPGHCAPGSLATVAYCMLSPEDLEKLLTVSRATNDAKLALRSPVEAQAVRQQLLQRHADLKQYKQDIREIVAAIRFINKQPNKEFPEVSALHSSRPHYEQSYLSASSSLDALNDLLASAGASTRVQAGVISNVQELNRQLGQGYYVLATEGGGGGAHGYLIKQTEHDVKRVDSLEGGGFGTYSSAQNVDEHKMQQVNNLKALTLVSSARRQKEVEVNLY